MGAVTAELAERQMQIYEGVGAWPAPANDNWPPVFSPTNRKRLVILESPYAGDIERNVAYARACLRDSLMRGEAPIASHLLYTQPGVLDDNLPDERILGIDAGLSWRFVAEASVVYTDLGMSKGMSYGIQRARDAGKVIEYRTIGWGE